MLSLNIKKINQNELLNSNINVKKLLSKYYEECSKIDFSLFMCPICNRCGTFIIHGYYTRKIKINGTIYKIRILRVKCKECGKTHAVLPFFVIPYIQTSLTDALMIIETKENKEQILTEEYRIIKNYYKWLRRLKAIDLSFKANLKEILNTCIKVYKMFFLQNHQGQYFIFS